MRKSWIVVVVAVCLLGGLWVGWKYRPAPPPVARLPEFTLPDLDGRPRSISEWSGRPLIVNFWATWCAPCRREMPLLQEIHERRGDDGLAVIGVALDDPAAAKKFVDEIGVTYPNLHGEHEGTVVAESLGADFVGLPYSAFVAPDGEIVGLHSGELDAAYLARIAVQLGAVADGRRSAAEARESLRVE
jgi:thiol-disulfide isomerase/thioredoxin